MAKPRKARRKVVYPPGSGKIEACPWCGQSVKPGMRKVPHSETDECLVRRTRAHYLALGYRTPLHPHARILRSLGVKMERDIVGMDVEVTGPNAGKEFPRVGWWAPGWAVDVVESLAGMSLTAGIRECAVRLLLNSQDMREAFEVVRRVSGPDAAVQFVRTRVRESFLAAKSGAA